MKVLVIDHRDSFVFNLVEDIERIGARCEVVRSDTPLEIVRERPADLILLSPGPGAPADAGVMLPLLRSQIETPILGVCLGLQAMIVASGGQVGRAPGPVHGRASDIRHRGDPIFTDVPEVFPAARYHSLVATRCPPVIDVIASCRDDGVELPMAIRHNELPWVGLQFHPESILSPDGPIILRNILRSLS